MNQRKVKKTDKKIDKATKDNKPIVRKGTKPKSGK